MFLKIIQNFAVVFTVLSGHNEGILVIGSLVITLFFTMASTIATSWAPVKFTQDYRMIDFQNFALNSYKFDRKKTFFKLNFCTLPKS